MAENETDPGIEVRTYFARGKNALVARAEFSELYAALYLHQLDAGIRLEPAADQLIRDALAALTLHCASRPWNESTAWTVNIQDPLANVFVAGDNRLGTVIGSVFTENVREGKTGLFYADTVVGADAPRRSTVEITGGEFFAAVETFYAQSEQRPARLFRHDEEDIVMVSAQPDCDLDWLQGLDAAAVRRLDREVELALLEQRHYRFACGCNQERILAMILPMMREGPDELFQGEEVLRIHCPRCGTRHTVTRELVEARLAGEGQKKSRADESARD
jgi:molecular chaperone Hsp33